MNITQEGEEQLQWRSYNEMLEYKKLYDDCLQKLQELMIKDLGKTEIYEHKNRTDQSKGKSNPS